MKLRLSPLAVTLVLAAVGHAPAQDKPPELPTWKDVPGIVPYRRLQVDDFPINDTVHPKQGMYLETAIEPRYNFIIKPHGGFAYAYVDHWAVFAGLNKKETSRKKAFKTMKAELPYAQALLDINEIHARQLAALKPGELPNARGNSFEEAQTELNRKLKEFLEVKYQENRTAMGAFAKATDNGAKKKVRELAGEIKKQLEATPAATVPYPETTAAGGAGSPASASPSGGPSASPVAPAPSAAPSPVR